MPRPPKILDVIDSYIYSLKSIPATLNYKRIATKNFLHALNRRGVIPNDELSDLIRYAMALLEDLQT